MSQDKSFLVNKSLKVIQVRSGCGQKLSHRATLIGLGLDKINRSFVHLNTPELQGRIYKIRHLVKVESMD